MTNLLEVKGLTASYDGPPVIRDITLSVAPGELVALLGPNGAGKSTTLLSISGLLQPLEGSILFDGKEIRNKPAHKIASMGLVQVPEGRALVASLTVEENFRLPRERVMDPYEIFPELLPLRKRAAGLLSGGEQQMLSLARALVMGPRLLLVDELSLGLAPILAERLLGTIRSLVSERGLSALIVEQHVARVLSMADSALALSRGRVAVSGPAASLRNNAELLRRSYMGDAPFES